jgi:AcrR family transcriptional regulator
MTAITGITGAPATSGSAGRVRRTRAQAREEILLAASTVFVELGYDAATLEEIARRVGVTRTGVLYHFHSKEALLAEIIGPLLADVETLLSRTARVASPTPAQRREVLRAMLDLVVAHRHASRLLVRDPSAVHALDVGPAVARHGQELAARLGGAPYRTDPQVRLRVATAIAALRGLTGSWLPVNLDDAGQRSALVDIVEDMLDA